MQTIDMAQYYTNLALKDFSKSLMKDRVKYFKCWVNDHAYVLMDYNINLESFINNLINN